MFIYCIIDNTNGKKYVGQHVGSDLEAYFQKNIRAAKRGSKDKPFLYNAMRAHGSEQFVIMPVMQVETQEALDYHETRLIKEWNTTDETVGYNLCLGGPGVKPNDVTRLKQSSSHIGKPGYWLGRKRSEETKAKIGAKSKGRQTFLGRKHSEETKKLMKESKVGFRPSDMAFAAAWAANTGRPCSLETRKKIGLANRKKNA